jgi:hypothetical protein
MVTPEEFGAVGDGKADDTAALQAALDRARGAGVLLSGRIYATTATLLLPSGTTVQGMGAVIRARADNQPVLASAAWANRRAETRGRTRVAGLRIEATGRGPAQDGIVLHDFWSELADLEIVDAGGRGIVLTATDRGGTPIGSTLVENRVRRCVVRNCGGTAFWLGEPANGKLTDGELSDCIGTSKDGSTAPIVVVGHAAGWTLRNIHTYGGRPGTAIEIRQAYFTRVSALYVEGFDKVGLALPQIQTDVTIADVQIVAERFGDGAAFIELSGHRDYPAPLAEFTNVVLTNLGQETARALVNGDGKVRIGGTPIVVGGPGADRITPGDLPGPSGPALSAAAPNGKRSVTWTGRDRRAIQIASKSAREAFADAHLVTLTGRSSDGALTTAFAGMIHWARAAADAQAVLLDLVPFGTPFGFQQLPSATFAREGDRLVLMLSFAPVASGPGQLTLD